MPKRWSQMGDGAHDYWDFVDIEVTATATKTIAIKARSLVLAVLAEVITAYDSATSASLVIGDGSDADGFLVASDAKAAAGTLYGDAVAEIGVYLYNVDHIRKWYSVADTIDAVLTITGATTVGKVRVHAHLLQLDIGN